MLDKNIYLKWFLSGQSDVRCIYKGDWKEADGIETKKINWIGEK